MMRMIWKDGNDGLLWVGVVALMLVVEAGHLSREPTSFRVRVLCTTTVIPAKAGASAGGTTIQRGRATECKAKRQV